MRRSSVLKSLGSAWPGKRPHQRPATRRLGLDSRGSTLSTERLEDRQLLAIDTEIVLTELATGLTAPVVATHPDDGSGRLFIAEQGGAIRILENGALRPTPLLDLGAGGLNVILSGGERGLLGLAFHPQFANTGSAGEGKFYVYYSAPASSGDHDSVVSEFQISAGDPHLANVLSERELLRFNQPFSNHNAGDLHFGPDDGLLYISTGDGGSSGDPINNAQNLENLLGKILRINVNGSNGPGGQYGIPTTNPFRTNSSARDEIYAYGFRNPYRFSFDDGSDGANSPDRLFAADVGQNSLEEVNLVTAGGNYGWRIREGTQPFSNDPDPGNLIDPIAEYPNDETTDAVIGGFVYRGQKYPALDGLYLFSDLTGRMFVLEEDTNGFTLADLMVRDTTPLVNGVLAMGADEAGELYVMTPTSLLAVEVEPVAQQSAGSLTGAAGLRIEGINPDDNTGRSVSGIGDINGDGFDDVVIGADGSDTSGSLAGEAFVLFGRATGFADPFDLATLDGTNGFRLAGLATYDQLGLASSAGGDINGDGIGDLLVGALGSDANGYDSGQTYVVFGRSASPFPASVNLADLDGTNGFTISGAAEEDFAGVSVAAAGDVNGDGFDDVTVGAPYHSPLGRANAGAAYVVFGRAGTFPADLELSTLDGTNGFALHGASEREMTGFAVSGAGDFNGDGLHDVVVGAYDSAANGSSSGTAYIFYGRQDGIASFDLAQLHTSQGLAVRGANPGDYAGWSVGGDGDVNGDGFDDVVVGAYLATVGENSEAGTSYVVFGSGSRTSVELDLGDLDGSNGFALPGASQDDQSGRAVQIVEDVNADGYADVLIGARQASVNGLNSAGKAYLVFGNSSPFPASLDLATLDGEFGLELTGEGSGDFLGISVQSAGDVNGDGFGDIILGAPGSDRTANGNEGAAYLAFGSDFLGRVKEEGGPFNDELEGDVRPNNLVGGRGDDTIRGAGGADVLIGAAGDDTLVISSTDFLALRGGHGSDRLELDGSGLHLDLTVIPNQRVSGLETVDIRGSGANSLTLDVRDVLSASDTTNELLVRKNFNDVVEIGVGWTEGGVQEVGGVVFNVFQQANARLLIEDNSGPPWQNPSNPLDVNNDGFITPVGDVLPLINELNQPTLIGAGGSLPLPPVPPNDPPPFYDVSGDSHLTPVQDVLPLINHLNNVSGEGEAAAGTTGPWHTAPGKVLVPRAARIRWALGSIASTSAQGSSTKALLWGPAEADSPAGAPHIAGRNLLEIAFQTEEIFAGSESEEALELLSEDLARFCAHPLR